MQLGELTKKKLIRPATAEEIAVGQANTGSGLNARITTVETVSTDLEGRLEASRGLYVNAGGRVAGMRVYAASGDVQVQGQDRHGEAP